MYELIREVNDTENGRFSRQYRLPGDKELHVGKVGVKFALGWTTDIKNAIEFIKNPYISEFFDKRILQLDAVTTSGVKKEITKFDFYPMVDQLDVVRVQSDIDRTIIWQRANSLILKPTITLLAPAHEGLADAAYFIDQDLDFAQVWAITEDFYTQTNS